MTSAIELVNVSKIYKRFSGRQFATLKSALLKRSLLRDLRPNEAFVALNDVSFSVARSFDSSAWRPCSARARR